MQLLVIGCPRRLIKFSISNFDDGRGEWSVTFSNPGPNGIAVTVTEQFNIREVLNDNSSLHNKLYKYQDSVCSYLSKNGSNTCQR